MYGTKHALFVLIVRSLFLLLLSFFQGYISWIPFGTLPMAQKSLIITTKFGPIKALTPVIAHRSFSIRTTTKSNGFLQNVLIILPMLPSVSDPVAISSAVMLRLKVRRKMPLTFQLGKMMLKIFVNHIVKAILIMWLL